MFNTIAGRDDKDTAFVPHPLFGADEYLATEPAAEDPDHYNKGISPYDVAKTMYGAEGLLTFVTVNSIKYIQRYPHKYKGSPDKQLDDLIKAKRSLETAIELHKEIHGDQHIRHG